MVTHDEEFAVYADKMYTLNGNILQEISRERMLWQRVERKRPGAVSRGTYILLPENYDNLRHAFNQFKGIKHPHNFDSVLSVVSYFMSEYLKGDVIWDHNQLAWKSGE